MANYYSFTVTEKTFHVVDAEAFREELFNPDIQIEENEDGSIWIGGYDAPMVFFDQDDNEVDVAEIIQKHIKPGDYAIIQTVGYEKLRYVDGAVYVITKEKVLIETLDSVMRKLIEQLEA